MYTSTKTNVNFLFCYLFGLLYCNIYQRDEYKVYLVWYSAIKPTNLIDTSHTADLNNIFVSDRG